MHRDDEHQAAAVVSVPVRVRVVRQDDLRELPGLGPACRRESAGAVAQVAAVPGGKSLAAQPPASVPVASNFRPAGKELAPCVLRARL